MTAEAIDFDGLAISFDDRVLRPRTWTAEQSRWGADLLPGLPWGPVLELCCGAGHIGLLTVRDSDRRLVCVDADPVAAAYTRENARAAGLQDRVEVREGRLESAVAPDEAYALVVADPPWVRRAETGRFPEDPLLAIDGGDDGLLVARACLAVIARHLLPGGAALLQLGTREQADTLADEATGLGLRGGETRVFERGVVLRLDRPDH